MQLCMQLLHWGKLSRLQRVYAQMTDGADTFFTGVFFMGIEKNFLHFTVSLQDKGWQFETPSHLSILEAALAAGITLPNSCRNGTCRTCMCKLVSGQLAYRIEWPGLSKDEKDEGWILPCVATALTDLVVAVAHPVKAEREA